LHFLFNGLIVLEVLTVNLLPLLIAILEVIDDRGILPERGLAIQDATLLVHYDTGVMNT
jgi:hypothetical protein